MKNHKNNLNWPGWPLENNPFGEEFDLAARKRMLAGSNVLYPFFNRYKKDMGNYILEVGPFFSPLVTPKEFPKAKIFYWENDYHVLGYLNKIFGKKVQTIFCDLNKIEGNSLLKLKLETKKCFKEAHSSKISFDSVIISHVLNYVDYRLFLMVLKDFIKTDGLIFINNVTNYGLPVFFSDKRPRGIPETIRVVKETGYNVLEKKIFESPNKRYQKNKRLVLVARNND
jgi:hypothetical protein